MILSLLLSQVNSILFQARALRLLLLLLLSGGARTRENRYIKASSSRSYTRTHTHTHTHTCTHAHVKGTSIRARERRKTRGALPVSLATPRALRAPHTRLRSHAFGISSVCVRVVGIPVCPRASAYNFSARACIYIYICIEERVILRIIRPVRPRVLAHTRYTNIPLGCPIGKIIAVSLTIMYYIHHFHKQLSRFTRLMKYI